MGSRSSGLLFSGVHFSCQQDSSFDVNRCYPQLGAATVNAAPKLQTVPGRVSTEQPHISDQSRKHYPMGYALVVARNGANDVSDPRIFSWWLISESISTTLEPGRNQLWTKLRYKSLDLWKILRGVSQSIRPGRGISACLLPG